MDFFFEHAKWVFSGLGTTLVAAWVSRRRRSNAALLGQSASYPEPISVLPAAIPSPSCKRLETIADRLQCVTQLIERDSESGHFNSAKIARILGEDSMAKVEAYSNGSEVPTFEWVELFCSRFGVRYDWLSEGVGPAFQRNIQGAYHYSSENWLEDLVKLDPKKILFLREESSHAPATIILKLDEWNYRQVGKGWHISDHVGNGGASQLLGMYRLITGLKNSGMSNLCTGATVGPSEYSAVTCGNRYPGYLFGVASSPSYWWDDLTDIHHRYPIAENYGDAHGSSFLAAQRVIRYGLMPI